MRTSQLTNKRFEQFVQPVRPAATYRRREFLPFNVLMLVRALAGPERSNRRQIIFTEGRVL
jgi:hypothetical protein